MGYWTNQEGMRGEPDPQFDPRNQGFTWNEDVQPPRPPVTDLPSWFAQNWQEGNAGAYGNQSDSANMQDYLQRVATAVGQPGFNWLPHLDAASNAHKGTYGIPLTSGRSNWTAATNDVLNRANPAWGSQYGISQADIDANTAGIRSYQDSFTTKNDWKMPAAMIAAVISAGLLAPAAVGGIAAAEAGGAAALGSGLSAGAAGTGVGMGLGSGLTAGAGATGAGMGLGAGLTTGALGGGALSMASLASMFPSLASSFGAGAGATPIVGGEMAGPYGPGEFGTGLPQAGMTTASGGLEQLVTELAKKVGMEAAKALVTGALSGGGGGAGAAGGGPGGNMGNNIIDLINSILGGRAAGKAEDSQRALLQQAIDSDLWRPQQGRYFEPLYDTVTKGIGDTPYGKSLIDSTLRQLSNSGGDPWSQGSTPHEVARTLDRGTNERITAVAPLAMGRPMNTQIFGQMAPGIVGSQTRQGNYGGALESIFGPKGMFPVGGMINKGIESGWDGLFGTSTPNDTGYDWGDRSTTGYDVDWSI